MIPADAAVLPRMTAAVDGVTLSTALRRVPAVTERPPVNVGLAVFRTRTPGWFLLRLPVPLIGPRLLMVPAARNWVIGNAAVQMRWLCMSSIPPAIETF